MKKISVCTPCFNEEGNVRRCYDIVRHLFETELPGYEREHISRTIARNRWHR